MSEEDRKQRDRLYRRKYRESHRDQIRQMKRKWDRANPEKILAMHRRYRNAHLEQDRQHQREYREKNQELLRDKRCRYYTEHRDEILARKRVQNSFNRPRRLLTTRIRIFGPASVAYYEAKLVEQEGKCAICRRPQNKPNAALALDHNHDIAKTDPASFRGLLCGGCNHVLGHCREDFGLLGRSPFADYVLRYMIF
jgi:hypothetical protein